MIKKQNVIEIVKRVDSEIYHKEKNFFFLHLYEMIDVN